MLKHRWELQCLWQYFLVRWGVSHWEVGPLPELTGIHSTRRRSSIRLFHTCTSRIEYNRHQLCTQHWPIVLAQYQFALSCLSRKLPSDMDYTWVQGKHSHLLEFWEWSLADFIGLSVSMYMFACISVVYSSSLQMVWIFSIILHKIISFWGRSY